MMEYIYELIEKIKSKQLEILELEKQLSETKKAKSQLEQDKEKIEAQLWKDIVFSKEYKNDSQRKSALRDMLCGNEDYALTTRAIEDVENQISEFIYKIKRENIELDYLKRLYEVELNKQKQEV